MTSGPTSASPSNDTDAERLASYVAVWRQAVDDFCDLLETLDPAEWDLPTDLPGWDVRAIAAHTAHLESVLARGVEEHADVGEPPHARGIMGAYTEIGVVNRRGSDPGAIVAEIRDAAATRAATLEADPPTDGSAPPPYCFGGMPWTTDTLLRNRPLDVWLHEQDVRRATGRPGGMDSPAARHTIDYLADGFGYVVGRRVGPPPGTSAVLAVAGHAPRAVEVGEDGRARPLPQEPATPSVRLAMDRPTYVVLAAGRREAEPGAVEVTGDTELGHQLLAALATTP